MAAGRPTFGEIAAAGDGRDPGELFIGPLLLPRDEILRSKGRGDLSLYRELLRDDQVFSCWQQRRRAVVSREWEVLPGGKSRRDKAAADFIRETLQRIGFDNLTQKMLAGVFYGYGVAECLWGRDGARIVLDDVKVRDANRFRFDRDRRLRLLRPGLPDGEAMPDRKFWTYAAGADDDDSPYGLGLGHWLYWPVWFKRLGMKSWAIFQEKFASPTLKGSVPRGASEEERNRLLQALRAHKQDSAIVVPEGVAIDLIEAGKRSGGDYAAFHDHMNEAISKIVLSQTMTSDNGSSLAQAQVHQGVKLEVVKGDADLICESANKSWIRWLVDWNFPGAAPPQVWREISEPEDLKARAERDAILAGMGFTPSDDYVRETYGEGWQRAAPLSGLAADRGAPLAPAFAEPGEDPAQAIGEDLASDWEPVVTPLVEAVEALLADALAKGQTLAEVSGRLGDLIAAQEAPAAGQMDPSPLADRLARTMFAAHATGQAGADLGVWRDAD